MLMKMYISFLLDKNFQDLKLLFDPMTNENVLNTVSYMNIFIDFD